MEGFGNFKTFKTDERPKKHGWAPGEYTCKCSVCACDFVGDKRASMCADCAYSPEIEARQAKKDKEALKKKVISLHLNNPKLSDEALGKHFGISGPTAAKYVREYHKLVKPRIDFYDNLMLLAKEIKATDLNSFYNFIIVFIDKLYKKYFEVSTVVNLLELPESDVKQIFEHCVKHKIFIKRLMCECGQLVLGDFPQCPTCKVAKFVTVFEVMPRLLATNPLAVSLKIDKTEVEPLDKVIF